MVDKDNNEHLYPELDDPEFNKKIAFKKNFMSINIVVLIQNFQKRNN